ncbi:YfgM family protein [Carnimonas bestiolae]|uniref:YfgM family protein n=1 Tax=Carnimonas bestiolae TaxID=3402172 RepID=UPI003EDB8A8F
MARDIKDIDLEDEQSDAFIGWWKRNGVSLIAGVLLAVAAILAWNAWQQHKSNQAASASQMYDQLMELTSDFTKLPDEQRNQVSQLANKLADEHGGTLYADFARLIQARVAVDAGDTGTAAASLQQLISSAQNDFVKQVATINLARVQIARKDYETALKTLDIDIPNELKVQQLSARGDALVGLQRLDDARKAYQTALDTAKAQQMPNYGIQLKLDDIAPQEAS